MHPDLRPAQPPRPRKLLLVYWGRQGVNRLIIDIVDALMRRGAPSFALSVSRQNAVFGRFAALGPHLVDLKTFSHAPGALCLWRILPIRRRIADVIAEQGITDVITLMPHVWSFLTVSSVHAAGARYHTILHDARRHPGDGTGLVLPLLLRDAQAADTVFTLSQSVTDDALRMRLVNPERIVRLFHPMIGAGGRSALSAPVGAEPWRLLFLGRIMAYKGLPLLIETVAQLQAQKRPVVLSVYGQGSLDHVAEALTRVGAVIVNRWLNDDEVAAALASHHAVVMSHVEASQSGIAALAGGAGIPVVATPVGALTEQVRDGVTGLLAERADADALATALRRLMDSPGLHARLAANVSAARQATSTDAFIDAMLKALDR